MTRLLPLLLCTAAVAAPVPKEKPDPLPDGALVRLGSARFRGLNTDGVTFSKDGKTLYATDDKNTVLRWDARTGKPLEPITFDVKLAYCSRVRGDRVFVVAHATPTSHAEDNVVHVFDLPNGRSLGKFDPRHQVEFTRSYPGLLEVDVSPDGRRLALHSHTDKVKRVYDVSGDEPSETLALKIVYAGNVLLSPDGGRLLVAAETSSTVYDVKDGAALCTIPASIRHAAFTPDGSKLVGHPWVLKWDEGPGPRSGRWIPGRVTVWDVTTGKEVATPDVSGLVWQFTCPSADTLFVGHSVKGVPVIARRNLRTGKEEWAVPVPFLVAEFERAVSWYTSSRVPMFAVSPDGKRVAISDRFCRMVLLDAETGKRVDDDPNSHPAAVQWAGFSSDGKTVTTATDCDVREWDAATGEFKAAYPIPDLIMPGFAGATHDLLVWRDWKGSSKIPQELVAWDRKAKKLAWRMTPDPAYGPFARTAGDGILVDYWGEGGQSFSMYDQAGKRRDTFEVATVNRYTEVTGLTADTMIRFGNGKPGVNEFELLGRSLKTGKQTSSCQVPFDPNTWGHTCLIQPSADGKYVGLGCHLGEWMAVEWATGKVLASGKAEATTVHALPFSPDGTKVLVQQPHPVVRLHELKEKGKMWALDSKGATASAVAFSPDGKRAIVGYRDGTALIWDVSK